MSSFDNFWDEFQECFGRAPVWLPGTPMQLGEVGVIDRRGYLRVAHLTDFGISFQTLPAQVDTEYSVASEAATMLDFGASAAAADPAGALTAADVGMRVTFSAAGGFVVRCKAAGGERIVDVDAVETQIKDKHRHRHFWRRQWIYVQEVVTAEPCIMIVSASSHAGATVQVNAGAGFATFAQALDAKARLSVSDRSSIDQYMAVRERAPFMWRGRWRRNALRRDFGSRGSLDEAVTADAGEPSDDWESAPEELFDEFDAPEAFDRDLADQEAGLDPGRPPT